MEWRAEHPVLLLGFNRPQKMRRVLDAVRHVRPTRLYVAVDGPRAARPEDAPRCELVRRLVDDVDWPCEVHTRFLAENLGCRRAVSSAISWFFSLEQAGIVLEDDVVPTTAFIRFCDELLVRHARDEHIGSISGANLISERYAARNSHFLSRYPHVWGWASWRRSWERYEACIADLDGVEAVIRSAATTPWWRSYWLDMLRRVRNGEIDTWDYQWTFTHWLSGMLAITPARRLTTNIGFDGDATHESAPSSAHDADPEAERLFPLTHPELDTPDARADALTAKFAYGITLKSQFNRVAAASLPDALRGVMTRASVRSSG